MAYFSDYRKISETYNLGRTVEPDSRYIYMWMDKMYMPYIHTAQCRKLLTATLLATLGENKDCFISVKPRLILSGDSSLYKKYIYCALLNVTCC